MLPFYEELKPINVLFSTNLVKSFCLVYIALNIYVTFENHIYKFKSSCFREMLHVLPYPVAMHGHISKVDKTGEEFRIKILAILSLYTDAPIYYKSTQRT